MARRAAAGAVITGMIVGPHEVEQRIMQARLLQVQKNRIDSIQRAETAFGKSARGFSGRLKGVGITELQLLFATSFEDSQNVTGLADGESRQWIEEWEDTVLRNHFRRDRHWTFQAERSAI